MKNEFLRHTLSTIAYRFQKTVRQVGIEFGGFSVGSGSRTPHEILNHMYHVLNATRVFIVEEKHLKEPPAKLEWNLEIDRFNTALRQLDHVLADQELELNYAKRLIQGPFSDILTHIGQIAMLSRLYGNPIMREDFSSASITTGIA